MGQPSTVICMTHHGMGSADPTLSTGLAGKYFHLIAESGMLPDAICFYTEGVKLVIEGSPVLEHLRALEDQGVRLIICKTCTDFYGVTDKVAVGVVGGMTDIIDAQWRADKVITL